MCIKGESRRDEYNKSLAAQNFLVVGTCRGRERTGSGAVVVCQICVYFQPENPHHAGAEDASEMELRP